MISLSTARSITRSPVIPCHPPIAFFSIDTAALPISAECDTVDEYLVILNSGTATDCNFNNILDLCEAGDLNANGLADNCECIADINGDDRRES